MARIVGYGRVCAAERIRGLLSEGTTDMQYAEFEAKIDDLRSSGVSRREITRLLVGLDARDSSELVRKYVHEHLSTSSSRSFLSSLIAASGVRIERNDALALARHLRAESRSEESDMYAALHTTVSGDLELMSLLLQTLIVDASKKEIQPDLLFVFPEAKIHHPELFLKCVKICAVSEHDDKSFAGIISSVVCDLPPDKDEDTAKYVMRGLHLFDDAEWLRQVSDHRLCEITGGLFSLTSILLNLDLIESVLRFTLASFEQREPNNSLVRLLATPYTMWTDETEKLLPGLETVYEHQLGNVDQSSLISAACRQFRTMVFEDKKHLRMRINPCVAKQQKWRAYKKVRPATPYSV